MTSPSDFKFTWPEERIDHYTAYRVPAPLAIDGRLDKPSWTAAPRSPRFVDLISGEPTIHDTRSAVLWDDDYLYIGFWIEEPFIEAALTERDALIWTENDVEVFVAGQDAYYELEINALGTLYEALFVWEDVYDKAGFSQQPGLARDADGVKPWNGVGLANHPRGPRLGFFKWDLPGLKSGVAVDGTLNDNTDRDRGWTAEFALPWSGLSTVAKSDGRALPPRNGDTWRMNFSRFNTYKESPPAKDSSGWAWGPHGIWDSHIPELFPYIHFSTDIVGSK